MKPSYATSPGTSPANVFSAEEVDLLGDNETDDEFKNFLRSFDFNFHEDELTPIGPQRRESHFDEFERGVLEELSHEPLEVMFDENELTPIRPQSRESHFDEFERGVLEELSHEPREVTVECEVKLGYNDTKMKSEDAVSNRLCKELVGLCSGSGLSAKTSFECIQHFCCFITPEECRTWTRRLNDLDTLRSNVRKRINNDISELDFYKCYLGIYDDPKANHRYSMERPQKERKHAGKAIVFYVLSKFVEDPLSLDDQIRLFDGITTLKALVSNRDEMGALFDVFRSLRAVGMLLSPAGNQKVFMVIGSMVLGDGVFHQRGSHMTKKAKCLEAIVVALIKMFPAERCRKRRRNVDDGSSRSELAEVASAEESAAEPSSKRRRAD